MSSLPSNTGSVMLSPQHASVNGTRGISPVETPQPQSPQQFSSNGSISPSSHSECPSPPIHDKRKSDTFSAADSEAAKLKNRSHSSEDLKSMDDKKNKKLFVTPKLVAPAKKGSDEVVLKTIDARMKSEPYLKKFKLHNEILLHDYSAALFRQILLHGRLYLFDSHICFESKIFGIKTSEVIAIKDVKQIKKKSRFTVGIEIITNNNVKYSFASFVSRDKTYKDLLEAWKDVTGETHEDASSFSVDDDIDDEIINNEVENQNIYTQQIDGFDRGEETNSHPPTPPQQSEPQQTEQPKQIISETQQTKQDENSNSNNNKGEIILDSKSNNNNKNENQNGATVSSTTSQVAPTSQQQKPNGDTAMVNNGNSNNNNGGNSNTLSTIKEVEKSPLDEIYGSVDQYLSKDTQPQSILESQHSDFQELLSDNFNVSVVNFFRALYSDQCNFVHNYHVKRGDSNVNVKPWTFRDRFGTIREIEYVAPVNSPIGPDKTKIQETQRYHLTKTKLIVETDTIMLDIPYGDHFRIEAKWEVIETSAETCRLSISLCVRFIKKTWFKSKIETTTVKETKTSFDKWIQLAKQEVQKMLQIKPKPTAPSHTPASHTTTVPTLGKSLDKTEISRLKDEERIDSPKPHHTRSRSRQHLISSSGQVNNSPSSNSLLSNIISNQQTHSPALPPVSSPISNINQSHNNLETLSNSANDQLTVSPKQQLKSSKSSLKNESSLVKLKTPIGVLSLNGSQVTVLLVSFFLFILYITMYIQIVKLSSKMETMELIFKDVVNNNIYANNLNTKK
ncbi:hypothetical protein DICPUDRAFT_99088 [Dictyostelium purpureum]|uniref:VASt domain-containing protein n=1 Tax=Dictyostelium purpureum TaxID=5786 RepID=F0ZW53_DICPU|nr:uncharacterized protein DICPUDRAFT_99088 [Dictyostelium purpureum]EGC31812.1 hypothetical protein DICPUDRAFT_99088 [Dictyostelium purpureum]|eukprot:XP_003291646.1 hypothetical protein DICPUDRAFT_99088 [Dictyostelium purpureum]